VVITLSVAFYISRSAPPGIPPDQVETIVVRHENESSFDISPQTELGRKLLFKCEDVLLNLSEVVSWAAGDYDADRIRRNNAYIEIVFKENYSVPIRVYHPDFSNLTQMPSTKVMFVLNDEKKGMVLFRHTRPTLPVDNLIFGWNAFVVWDNVSRSIFQDLVEMVDEIQRL